MDSSLRSGGGRRKIPIVKIEKKEAGGVTFSKRRQGLFKKASDLSVLYGVDVAVLALSEAENPYCYAFTPSLIRASSPRLRRHLLLLLLRTMWMSCGGRRSRSNLFLFSVFLFRVVTGTSNFGSTPGS
ncbi:uncharacterized protein A4U43_C04F26150 [Asparagus officinalis]|uniref:MADS-box domain-containing protein n=1 Tax=Asparagus officinalis TaxID=4686 RepID=A0A5P1F3P9_ASPOF|nr:uncharacterized protein A4U43_C04F26150 [Asparagus officinalis]